MDFTSMTIVRVIRLTKAYEVYYNGLKVQNLNRYYFQRNAPLLFKKKKGGSKLENINVGEGVCLFNEYTEKSFRNIILTILIM
jgi:hypothetical protein